MPKWFEKVLKYNPGEKSLNVPLAIYLDLKIVKSLKITVITQENLEELLVAFAI